MGLLCTDESTIYQFYRWVVNPEPSRASWLLGLFCLKSQIRSKKLVKTQTSISLFKKIDTSVIYITESEQIQNNSIIQLMQTNYISNKVLTISGISNITK